MDGNKAADKEDLTPEDAAQRQADADARVAGIEAMLKDMSAKLEDTQAAADEAARKADESGVEGRELKKQLDLVMGEKNTVERMLEEMQRMKEAAEEAASAAEAERIRMRDENKKLLDTVTVLKDARAADHAAHAVTVQRWRNELVAYREKSPTEFLAEVMAMVRDMDNEVEVELIDAELAASRGAGGGFRAGRDEELQLCDEWTHNPRLALAQPGRLVRLASRQRSEAHGAHGNGGDGSSFDPSTRPASSLCAAGLAGSKGGVRGSQREGVTATPRIAAKRREALMAVDGNVVEVGPGPPAVAPAAPTSPLLKSHPIATLEAPGPGSAAASPAKLMRSAADDGLVAVTAADVENLHGSRPARATASLPASKAGFSAKATVDLSAVFGGVARGAAKPQTLGAGVDVYDDFADVTPASTKALATVAGK